VTWTLSPFRLDYDCRFFTESVSHFFALLSFFLSVLSHLCILRLFPVLVFGPLNLWFTLLFCCLSACWFRATPISLHSYLFRISLVEHRSCFFPASCIHFWKDLLNQQLISRHHLFLGQWFRLCPTIVFESVALPPKEE